MKLIGLQNYSNSRISINQVRTAEGMAFSVEPNGVVFVTAAVANHPTVKRFINAGLRTVSSPEESKPEVVLPKVKSPVLPQKPKPEPVVEPEPIVATEPEPIAESEPTVESEPVDKNDKVSFTTSYKKSRKKSHS